MTQSGCFINDPFRHTVIRHLALLSLSRSDQERRTDPRSGMKNKFLFLDRQRCLPATSGFQIRDPDQVHIGMTKEESCDYVSASQRSAGFPLLSAQRILDARSRISTLRDDTGWQCQKIIQFFCLIDNCCDASVSHRIT